MPVTMEEKRFIENAEEFIGNAKARIKRLQRIRSLQNHDGWKALKEEIEFSMKGNEQENHRFLEWPSAVVADELGLRDARLRAGENRGFKGVILNVEVADKKIDLLNEQIRSNSEKIKQLLGEDPEKKVSRRQPII